MHASRQERGRVRVSEIVGVTRGPAPPRRHPGPRARLGDGGDHGQRSRLPDRRGGVREAEAELPGRGARRRSAATGRRSSGGRVQEGSEGRMTNIWVRLKGPQAPRPGTRLRVQLQQNMHGRPLHHRRPCGDPRGRPGVTEAHRHAGGSRRRGAVARGLSRRRALGLEADAATQVKEETWLTWVPCSEA